MKARIAVAVLAALVALVAHYEGLRERAYLDAVGIPTICYGETRGVHLGDRKDSEQCKTMLKQRVADVHDAVVHCSGSLSFGEQVAYTSLAYNIGNDAYCKSSVARLSKAGKRQEACDALLRYVYAGGKVLPGLLIRREAEHKYCAGEIDLGPTAPL